MYMCAMKMSICFIHLVMEGERENKALCVLLLWCGIGRLIPAHVIEIAQVLEIVHCRCP